MVKVPAGEDKAWDGLDLTDIHKDQSSAHHILWKIVEFLLVFDDLLKC